MVKGATPRPAQQFLQGVEGLIQGLHFSVLWEEWTQSLPGVRQLTWAT